MEVSVSSRWRFLGLPTVAAVATVVLNIGSVPRLHADTSPELCGDAMKTFRAALYASSLKGATSALEEAKAVCSALEYAVLKDQLQREEQESAACKGRLKEARETARKDGDGMPALIAGVRDLCPHKTYVDFRELVLQAVSERSILCDLHDEFFDEALQAQDTDAATQVLEQDLVSTCPKDRTDAARERLDIVERLKRWNALVDECVAKLSPSNAPTDGEVEGQEGVRLLCRDARRHVTTRSLAARRGWGRIVGGVLALA